MIRRGRHERWCPGAVAAAALSVCAGVALVAPGPAAAGQNYFGALAANKAIGTWGYAFDQTARAAAQARALAECQDASPTMASQCRTYVWVRNGCAALAARRRGDGSLSRIAWGIGDTKRKAKQRALDAGGPRTAILAWTCTSRPVADLELSGASGPTAASSGSEFEYQFEVTNNGPSEAGYRLTPNVLVTTDTTCVRDPDVFRGAALASGGSQTHSVEVECTLDEGASCGSVTLGASVTEAGAGVTDPKPGNNKFTAADDLVVEITPGGAKVAGEGTCSEEGADVRVELSGAPGSAPSGEEFAFAATVTNDGPDPAPEVSISVGVTGIGDVGCTAGIFDQISPMAPGQSKSYSMSATCHRPDPDDPNVARHASVAVEASPTGLDPDTNNNLKYQLVEITP